MGQNRPAKIVIVMFSQSVNPPADLGRNIIATDNDNINPIIKYKIVNSNII